MNENDYDHVIYSVCGDSTMVLARLRSTSRLRVHAARFVADFDPHPAWVQAELDDDLGVDHLPSSRAFVGSGHPSRCCPSTPTCGTWIRRRRESPPAEQDVLIVGAARGLGNLQAPPMRSQHSPLLRPVIVTSHDSGLKQRLNQKKHFHDAVVYRFTEPPCQRSCSGMQLVLVANADRLTYLEAFFARVPVVISEPMPGHGDDDSRPRWSARASSPRRTARTTSADTPAAVPAFLGADRPGDGVEPPAHCLTTRAPRTACSTSKRVTCPQHALRPCAAYIGHRRRGSQRSA